MADELIARLVEERKEAGLTQAFVAHMMGTTQPTVSELERGETDPRLSTLRRYAGAIGVELRHEVTAVPRAWHIQHALDNVGHFTQASTDLPGVCVTCGAKAPAWDLEVVQ